MKDSEPKIRKGLAAAKDPTCFRVRNKIVIPAGTILRSIGDNQFACAVGFGASVTGELKITIKPGSVDFAAALDRVIA